MPCRNGVRAAHRHVEQPNRVHSVDLRFRRIACRADGDALDADARSACRHVDWSGHLCSCARSRWTGARHPAAALGASLHHSGGGEYPASGLTSGQSGAGDGWHGHPHGAREPSHCRTNRRERDKDEGYCSIGLGGTVRQAIAGWRQPRRSYPSAMAGIHPDRSVFRSSRAARLPASQATRDKLQLSLKLRDAGATCLDFTRHERRVRDSARLKCTLELKLHLTPNSDSLSMIGNTGNPRTYGLTDGFDF